MNFSMNQCVLVVDMLLRNLLARRLQVAALLLKQKATRFAPNKPEVSRRWMIYKCAKG